jgi:hypothetical protein
MMKADLHNHFGKNGTNPGFDETIDIAYRRLGPNSIIGVCNDGPDDYRFEKFVNQSGGKYGRFWLDDEKRIMLVPQKLIYIIGVEEVEPKQGHFIVVGMPQNQKIWKNKNPPCLEDALRQANDFNGAKVAVHPWGMEGLAPYLMQHPELFNQFDGWEVHNSSAELSIPPILPMNANKNSAELYNSMLVNLYDIGACSFTDGHSPEVIGTSYTSLNLSANLNSKDWIGFYSPSKIKNAIRENKDFRNLHMEPAKWDAFKHCGNMVMQIAFGIKA